MEVNLLLSCSSRLLLLSPPQLCVKCLVTVGQMLEVLDKHIVMEQILPTTVQIRSREPGVLMGILGG